MNYPAAYCVKCRSKTDTANRHTVVLENKSRAMTGACPKCGNQVYRFMPRKGQTLMKMKETLFGKASTILAPAGNGGQTAIKATRAEKTRQTAIKATKAPSTGATAQLRQTTAERRDTLAGGQATIKLDETTRPSTAPLQSKFFHSSPENTLVKDNDREWTALILVAALSFTVAFLGLLRYMSQ